jgi:serine protease Do
MNKDGMRKLVIRHLSGSKANQIEEFPLAGVKEITLGRDPKCQIAFDPIRDTVVSRRHARITVVGDEHISFRLADLGSHNGTFLNGEQITEEENLLPDDTIELGKSGVKFEFDVVPRPEHMAARTRLMDIGATRVINTAEVAAQDALTKSATTQKFEQPPNIGFGKETIVELIREQIGQHKRSTRHMWISLIVGVAALAAASGGAFYWKQKQLREQLEQQSNLQQQRSKEMEEEAEHREREEAERRDKLEREQRAVVGRSSQEILKDYAAATAQIKALWHLVDLQTGSPVYHQTYSSSEFPAYKKADIKDRRCTAFVRLPANNRVVRWLTLDSNDQRNVLIGGTESGTGFVVSEGGYMLTNKHVAAAWNVPFEEQSPAAPDHPCGWLFDLNGGPRATTLNLKTPTGMDLSSEEYADLREWVPGMGGVLFSKDLAVPISGRQSRPNPKKKGNVVEPYQFEGRNDKLEITFSNSRVANNAHLARYSSTGDAALIRVEMAQKLKPVELAEEEIAPGERVVVIGTTTEGPPQPFVTEGIVSMKGSLPMSEKEGNMWMGDVIQMSVNSGGTDSSGGPVFNKEEKVIGISTNSRSIGSATTSFAIPIKYGSELMNSPQE